MNNFIQNKKTEELKKQVEKVKNEKAQLLEENKKITNKLNKIVADNADLKAEIVIKIYSSSLFKLTLGSAKKPL